MPTDRYEPYRMTYTPQEHAAIREETERKARRDMEVAAGIGEKVDGGYRVWDRNHEDSKFYPEADPMKVKMQIALDHAQQQLQGWPLMPEDTESTLRFPGVDPIGHCSIIDMKFHQREARIHSCLQTRSAEVAAYARELMECRYHHDPRSGVRIGNGTVYAGMLRAAEGHRQLSRAAKITPEPEVSQALTGKARELETCQIVSEYDKFLQGVEYAAGVRTGPVPQEVTALFQERYAVKLDPEMIQRAQERARTPGKLQIEFENLDNKLLHRQFADPANWGKKPADASLVHLSGDVVDDSVAAYARATADRVISPLFAQAERNSANVVNRTDLIIVGGKTVSEIMMEQFKKLHPGGSALTFEKYREEHQLQATNEIVAAGLMSGKRVEAFVPHADGTIPKEPVQITKTGFEPSPLNPVTMNGWQRFWSKRGFFKEKAAQLAEYNQALAARERVQIYNTSALFERDSSSCTASKAMFFQEDIDRFGSTDLALDHYKAQTKSAPGAVDAGFACTRETLVTFATLKMLEDGHKIEDIMDPNKLQRERREAGRGLIEKAVSDPGWAADRFLKGGQILNREIDRLAQCIDLTDSRTLLSPAARPFIHAVRVGFDAFQEMNHIRPLMEKRLSQLSPEQNPGELYDQYRNDLSLYGHIAMAQGDVHKELSLVLKGVEAASHSTNLLGRAISLEASARQAAKNKAADPTAAPRQFAAPEYAMFGYTAAMGTKAFQAADLRMEADPAYRVQMAQRIRSGELFKSLSIEADIKTFRFALDIPEAAPKKAKQPKAPAKQPKVPAGRRM